MKGCPTQDMKVSLGSRFDSTALGSHFGVARVGPDKAYSKGFVRLRDASAEEVILWAAQRYGEGLVVSTSFGATAAVMLHLVAGEDPTSLGHAPFDAVFLDHVFCRVFCPVF